MSGPPPPYIPSSNSGPPPFNPKKKKAYSPYVPPENSGPPPFVPPASSPYVPPANSGPPPYIPPAKSGPPPFVPPKNSGPGPGSDPYVPRDKSPPPYVPPEKKSERPPFEPYVPPPPPATFEDYIAGGCEIDLAVAIDFSSSNGDPRKLGTLHYLSFQEGDKNDYELALAAIGSSLAKHDSTKKFPMWGFGGKYDGQIRNCFQCGRKVEVDGIEGLLNAYPQVFKSGMAMSEPTVITEVITTAAYRAKKKLTEARAEGGESYSILLILTDGQISGLNDTARTIFEVTDTPLSIVAVGIGDGDFTNMRQLDDLEKDGRNIFKFVALNDLKNNMESVEKVAMERLPKQLLEYFTKHGIEPREPTRQEESGEKGDDIVLTW